jgi:hypothetical protein
VRWFGTARRRTDRSGLIGSRGRPSRDARSSRPWASLRGTKRESDEGTPVFLCDHDSRDGTVAAWAFSTNSVRERRRDAPVRRRTRSGSGARDRSLPTSVPPLLNRDPLPKVDGVDLESDVEGEACSLARCPWASSIPGEPNQRVVETATSTAVVIVEAFRTPSGARLQTFEPPASTLPAPLIARRARLRRSERGHAASLRG